MAWSEFSVRLPGYARETAGHRQDALRYSLQEGGRSWWGGRGLGFGVRELCPWNSQKLHPRLRKPGTISPAWICNDYFLLRRAQKAAVGSLE